MVIPLITDCNKYLTEMNPENLKMPARISYPVSIKKIIVLGLLLSLPLAILSAQTQKDVEIILECIEYIGNDKCVANFGYNNPNKKEVAVPETNSSLIVNDGQSQSKALNRFKPGRQSPKWNN
jgi:hypothetical protein